MKKIQNTEQANALKKGDAIVYLSRGIEQEFQITRIDDLAVFAMSKNGLFQLKVFPLEHFISDEWWLRKIS